MIRADRPAALFWLAVAVLVAAVLSWIVALVAEVLAQRPVVTKDPHTGDLYIPRSDLHITRRHRP